jgi:hypothetical protein
MKSTCEQIPCRGGKNPDGTRESLNKVQVKLALWESLNKVQEKLALWESLNKVQVKLTL